MTTHTTARFLCRLGALCISLALSQALYAQTVRLHGATTLEKLLSAQKQALETQTGLKLELVGNGAGRGVADLAGGKADIALIGGSLKGIAEAMNADKAGSIEITGMKEIPVASVKLVAITHPAIGLKTLADAQWRDVMSGKAGNWKDVGGPDVPVKLVLPFVGDGARTVIQENLLKGAAFGKNAVLRNSAKDLCVVVAQVPGACAILSIKNVEGQVAQVGMETELVMPLQLVVKGEAAGDVQKVVTAVETILK